MASQLSAISCAVQTPSVGFLEAPRGLDDLERVDARARDREHVPGAIAAQVARRERAPPARCARRERVDPLEHGQVFGHARLGDGRDRVDRDAVLLQLDRHRARQAVDARLGRRVVGLAEVAEHAAHARRVDDAPAAALRDDLLREDLRAEERALEVHRDDGVPHGLVHLEEALVAEDAGVVDEDVDAAEGVDGGLDEGRRRPRPTRRCRGRRRPCRPRCGSPRRPCSAALRVGPGDPSRAPPRSLTTTFAPSRAKRRACARPMPPPAPVTMTTLPSRSPIEPRPAGAL